MLYLIKDKNKGDISRIKKGGGRDGYNKLDY